MGTDPHLGCRSSFLYRKTIRGKDIARHWWTICMHTKWRSSCWFVRHPLVACITPRIMREPRNRHRDVLYFLCTIDLLCSVSNAWWASLLGTLAHTACQVYLTRRVATLDTFGFRIAHFSFFEDFTYFIASSFLVSYHFVTSSFASYLSDTHLVPRQSLGLEPKHQSPWTPTPDPYMHLFILWVLHDTET